MKPRSKNTSFRSRSKVAVIVLTYNGCANLEVCLKSLARQTYRNFEIFFYDQASSDGSLEYVKKNFPSVETYQFPENIGYARANNDAMRREFEKGTDFCLLMNDDTESDPRMIEEMISSYQKARKQKNVGLVQPTILLYDHRDKINSIGNAIHYLGFGYCRDFKKPYVPLKADVEITSASGAALLVSREYYERIGGFDEDFFMYNEDQNYSWRGLLCGYQHILSSRAVLYHKYNFRRNDIKIYNSEKNRLMILFENYSAFTLILLLPMIFFNESIAVIYSLFGGYFVKKLASLWYVLGHIGEIAKKRKGVQVSRTVSDKKIIRRFESELVFEEMKNPLLLYVVNPIYRIYYALILLLVP